LSLTAATVGDGGQACPTAITTPRAVFKAAVHHSSRAFDTLALLQCCKIHFAGFPRKRPSRVLSNNNGNDGHAFAPAVRRKENDRLIGKTDFAHQARY